MKAPPLSFFLTGKGNTHLHLLRNIQKLTRAILQRRVYNIPEGEHHHCTPHTAKTEFKKVRGTILDKGDIFLFFVSYYAVFMLLLFVCFVFIWYLIIFIKYYMLFLWLFCFFLPVLSMLETRMSTITKLIQHLQV